MKTFNETAAGEAVWGESATHKAVFRCSSIDESIAKYEGHPCTILRPLTSDEADEEVGPMFRVKFDDGHELDVFNDELER